MSGLSDSQVRGFHEQGYLLIDHLVPESIVQRLIDEIDRTIDELARKSYKEGVITDLCASYGFETRLIHLNQQSEEIYNKISVGQLHGPALFDFLTSKEILDVAESLVGPDLLNNGVYRVRPKLPSHPRTEVNWHQDAAYLNEEAHDTFSAAFWIPLVDANEENGCLWVIPTAHKRGVLKHTRTKFYLDIDPEQFPEIQPISVPVKRGGALIIHPWMPHCSKPHGMPIIRWSVDTRYQNPTSPIGYAGEAPFLVRSERWPHLIVRDPEEFARIRSQNIRANFR